jgi:RNA polymerase sigma factor (TIGR02999 family)
MDLTTLIAQMRAGDTDAEARLLEQVYPELYAIARQRLGGELYAAESTESLVHECYLRLKRSGLPEVADRGHFFAIVSRLMRQILVDFARARVAQRRDKRLEVQVDAAGKLADEDAERLPQLLEIDQQLRLLEAEAPDAARLVELRFFGGLTAEESAEHLGISLQRARRQLRYGQAWLRRAMTQNPDSDPA